MSDVKNSAPILPAEEIAKREEISKKIAEAMKRSEQLVKDALKLGRSLVGTSDEDLRIRLR